MTATAEKLVPPASGFTGTDRASPAQLELAARPRRDLETVFVRGATPSVDALVGWEFRGVNTPTDLGKLLGIQKFVKGFVRHDDGVITGYNSPVVQDGLARPWRTLPDDAAPKRFGFYRVAPVDPTARDNKYLHALLLDYGKGGNKPWDVTRGLRDYLVQVDRDNADLFLGKAYYALGPVRVLLPTFFILERFRPGFGEYARRR